MIDKFDNVNDL